MNQRFLRLGPNDFDEGAGDWDFFFELAVTHFVGDKAVNWISVFFTDGVSAKCFFLSFKCSMFTVQLHPLLNFCLSLLTADGPVCLRTLKCYISYISYMTHTHTRLKLWRFTLWASEMWVLWQMCKTYGLQWPRWNWEVGKKSFPETRCYFSVGGNVHPEKPENEVFKFFPASICSTCVLFFCQINFWERSVIMKRSLKAAPLQQSFDETPYQNSADCRGRMSACWCQFWRFEPLELKLWDKIVINKQLNS